MMAETNAHTEVPAGGKEMFPPFQRETFPSQLFWLGITFIILYLVLARVALPQATLARARASCGCAPASSAVRVRLTATTAVVAVARYAPAPAARALISRPPAGSWEEPIDAALHG